MKEYDGHIKNLPSFECDQISMILNMIYDYIYKDNQTNLRNILSYMQRKNMRL